MSTVVKIIIAIIVIVAIYFLYKRYKAKAVELESGAMVSSDAPCTPYTQDMKNDDIARVTVDCNKKAGISRAACLATQIEAINVKPIVNC